MSQYAPFYQHIKRPDWGPAVVIDSQTDRTSFGFGDGSTRTIMHEHLHMMQRVELEETEAEALSKRITKQVSAKSPLRAVKQKKAAAKKATAKAKALATDTLNIEAVSDPAR